MRKERKERREKPAQLLDLLKRTNGSAFVASQFCDALKITPTAIRKWLRHLEEQGKIRITGNKYSKTGRMIEIIEDQNGTN